MKYSYTTQFTTPSGALTNNKSITGDENYEADITLSPGGTNQAAAVSVVQANMQALLLLFTATGSTNGSIGGHATVKTNSSGSPQDTITLNDGVPVIWFSGGPLANPFSGNVTSFFITDVSTGSVGGTVNVRSLNNQ